MGLATAERFAQDGFRVILSARNADKTQELAEQLKAKSFKAEARAVDTSDPSSVAALIDGVERDYGAIDVLHYNAA
jgi:NAD(P)-dependent dehydrogenase (short-subunit alcohol dehydrogenase family)